MAQQGSDLLLEGSEFTIHTTWHESKADVFIWFATGILERLISV